jgi:hypothetical protein
LIVMERADGTWPGATGESDAVKLRPTFL